MYTNQLKGKLSLVINKLLNFDYTRMIMKPFQGVLENKTNKVITESNYKNSRCQLFSYSSAKLYFFQLLSGPS